MISYLKFYIIKNEEIKCHRTYLDHDNARQDMIRLIRQIFDAFDIEHLVNDLMQNIHKTRHRAFKLFQHMCEIHLFEVAPFLKDDDFFSLEDIHDEYLITHITLLKDDDSDDDIFCNQPNVNVC